ncbi:hypothetical protein [Aeromicrobium sp. CTD01-1L150]|uniref:hypothetical protein n=1 Tax=Aeromicrobium sp. CTD01-1L150 TaxID=3341830 RepID=UPI0035BEC0B4
MTIDRTEHSDSATTPDDVRILAAQVSMKADRRLGRQSPEAIVALANAEPAHGR